jgi:hypothetical protein
MLLMTNVSELAHALASPIHDPIIRLLAMRRDQLSADIADHVHFAIVQSGDPPAAVEAVIGLPIFAVPDYRPDWVQEHDCAFEMAFNLTEEFTQVIIIPKDKDIDRKLLDYATTIATEHA